MRLLKILFSVDEEILKKSTLSITKLKAVEMMSFVLEFQKVTTGRWTVFFQMLVGEIYIEKIYIEIDDEKHGIDKMKMYRMESV
jgi:hypothetical protein